VGLLLKGYKFWTASIEMRAGGIERLNARLEVDYASLDLVSVPTGASVVMDGHEVGKSPIHLDRLTPGEVHHIELRKSGFLPWSTEIKTEPGRLTTLRPVLERDPRASERPAPVVEPATPAPTTLPKIQ
jgi:hypothetical protein